MILKRHQRYLQIALNSTLEEARRIIEQIPLNERVLIEAGTPLIKIYGTKVIEEIKTSWEARVLGYSLPVTYEQRPLDYFTRILGGDRAQSWGANLLTKIVEKDIQRQQKSKEFKDKKELPVPYIVADLKCADLAFREVKMSSEAGASAATCLGVAPIETIDLFIEECKKFGLDSMVDMMNVESPVLVLEKLKKLPDIVMLHRGVDEEAFNPDKPIPFRQIQRIKDAYDVMVSIAGGDTINDVERAVFNDADIVVVWKLFYQSTDQTANLAQEFLKEIR